MRTATEPGASGPAEPMRQTPSPLAALGSNSPKTDVISFLTVSYLTCCALVGAVVVILSGFGLLLIVTAACLSVIGFTVAGRLDLACALVVASAMLSPLITVICHSPLGAYVSNIPLAFLTGVCVIHVLWHARLSRIGWFALTAIVVGIALLRAPSMTIGLYQARQVLVPVALIFSGFVAAQASPSLNSLRMAVIITGVINLIYMGIEAGMGPIISPIAAYEFKEFSRVHQVAGAISGLPGNYYFFYASGGAHLVRLGGLLFNPPVTGIFTGLLTIVAYWSIRNRTVAMTLAGLALVATIATFSRAGILLIVLGVGLPLVARRTGRHLGIFLFLGLFLLVAPVIQRQGSSSRHLEGFTASLNIALHHPLGQGFGHFGNSIKVSALSAPGESLLGVLIAGAGLAGLLLIGVLVIALFRAAERVGWIAWVGLAALVIAALSESAGGLAGTAALWLFPGIALGIAASQKSASGNSLPAAYRPSANPVEVPGAYRASPGLQ